MNAAEQFLIRRIHSRQAFQHSIKAQSPVGATIVSCLVNGCEGYIPSTKAHKEGGYEGLSSRFAAETGDRLVAAQVDQIKRLTEMKTGKENP